MNVKRTCLDGLLQARLMAELKYADRWQVLTQADIREHFTLAPNQVFWANGRLHAVKTRLARFGLYAGDLLNDARRQILRQELIDYIKRDEEAYRRRMQCDARYWVYSVRLDDRPMIDGAGSRYHQIFWRSAAVKPVGWQPAQ